MNDDYICLNDIETRLTYKDDIQKVESMAYRAAKAGIKVFIKKSDYEANTEVFFRATSHKLFNPKYVFNQKTIAQNLKEMNSPLKVATVRQRLKYGWTWEEALSVPTGSKRPSYENHRKRNQTGFKHKKAIVIKTNEHFASNNGKTTTLKDLYGSMGDRGFHEN